MMQEGKILFYNEQNGTGIIITPDKQKIDFDINSWEDFENMPSLGLDVTLHYKNNQVSEIHTKKKEPEVFEISKEIQLTPIKEEKKQQEYKTFRYKDQELHNTDNEVASLLSDANESLKTVHENISLTSNISNTMQKYFGNIYNQIKKREGYKKVDGRLDYILAKRFLWTTFNNLQDIDQNVITLRIQAIANDLLFMSTLEDDFQRKIRYPSLTFEEIFLSSQTEYKNIKLFTTKTAQKLAFLREKEKTISAQKKAMKKEIMQTQDLDKLKELQRKEKVLNGTYVDTVHIMASLQEEHMFNAKRLKKFEEQYKEDFNKEFKAKAKKYENFIIDILNAQAFLLDSLLWKEAKVSKPIQTHLKGLSVDIEFNTKEYLKYFLNTLDATKSGESTKELFKLYEHLKEIQKDYIIIVSASAQDAIEYQLALKEFEKEFKIKSFTDELSALRWAIKNNVKLIILEENLTLTNAKKFLEAYHNSILSKPRIILLGNQTNIHSNNFSIDKILSSTIAPQTLYKATKDLLYDT